MSSAGWRNWDDVSLLTDRHILRTDNSAIARMSEGVAVAWQSPGREDGRGVHERNTSTVGDFSAAFGLSSSLRSK